MPVGSTANIGSEIIGAYTTGFGSMISFIPNTIKTAFENFFTDGNGGLSVMSYILLILGGVGLVMGLVYLVWNLISRKLGA